MALAAVTLDDKYTAGEGQVFLSGIQALVRLPLMQRQLDAAAGLNTGGFISGYRGSPLGGLDINLWRAQKFLKANHIHFEPGLNEDLAATAVWGSQQIAMTQGPRYDGAFAMWYGKAPGVDRCGDVFRHGNFAGSAPNGGVLLLAGDDHMARSSTVPAQSEFAFMAAMIPVLYPAGVQEILDFGIAGWALSRYSGCWIGFKCVAENVESSATVSVDPDRFQMRRPNDFEMPEGGLGIRWPDQSLDQEKRLRNYKLKAAQAFARVNGFDRVVVDGPKARLGIVTAGKAYLDVRQAFTDLGLDEKSAARLGIRLYKVGMVWPMEPDGLKRFADGLEEILVVEEKRPVMESQVKDILYHAKQGARPRVVGKVDERGEALLSSTGELTPAGIARVIAARVGRTSASASMKERLAFLDRKEKELAKQQPALPRLPYFCSGCPHNTSTKVPEGSRAYAGIGCHFMAVWMNRNTETFTHMGAEGATWIGQTPFTDEKHVFVNLGDGTYYHSGILAIRASVAAKVNITYKILYNDAVAMTGGQPVEGQPTVPQITHQLAAEGVGRIAVVSDEPDKYPLAAGFAPGVTIDHRDSLDAIQRELREWPGVSALVYDQTCAAEKRRRRKRGLFPDPPRRIFINEAVCEGCGDCSVQSNCMSVIPVETEYGRKRAIDQSSCNKDYSCVKGFCPSFVTVTGGTPKQRKGLAVVAGTDTELPEAKIPGIEEPFDILISGIGGTGVVTIGALLGMAAHIEGKGATVLDMTGLAQKGGAVLSHVRVAKRPADIHAVRVAAGEANAVIGCDLVVAASADALAKMQKGLTRVALNSHNTATAFSVLDPDAHLPAEAMHDVIADTVGAKAVSTIDATSLATSLMGDSIATNLFMIGFAYQNGLVPISAEAIERAIELNAVAVDANKQAFAWGRRAAVDPDAVARAAAPSDAVPAGRRLSESLEEIVERRVRQLTDYQNAKYAARYQALVDRVRQAETEKVKGRNDLTEAVARGYFKLLAYKDEYEVARLYSNGDFRRKLADAFEGDYKLTFHLAPPLIAERDRETGQLKKRAYGGWMLPVFTILAGLNYLRGTPFDIFGYSAERRRERRLIGDYEAAIEQVLARLDSDKYGLAVEIAKFPDNVRGFGHVKERNIDEAMGHLNELLAEIAKPAGKRAAAE